MSDKQAQPTDPVGLQAEFTYWGTRVMFENFFRAPLKTSFREISDQMDLNSSPCRSGNPARHRATKQPLGLMNAHVGQGCPTYAGCRPSGKKTDSSIFMGFLEAPFICIFHILPVIVGRLLPWLVTCAFLLAAAPAAAATEELGRLFFTPERREALDWQRQSGVPERVEIPDEAPVLRIDGVVTRSSGKRTVWINGVAQNDAPDDGAAVIPERADPGRVLVRPENGPVIRAGVGDTVNRNTGETADRLAGGHIQIETIRRR
jgi:hypothetical protein